VALGASNSQRSRLMRKALHVLVAVNAGKHAAVNGVLEFGLIHEQADGLAVFLRGQASVAMAGKAIRILELLPIACG